MDLQNSSEIQEVARLLGAFRINGRLSGTAPRPAPTASTIPVLKLGTGAPTVPPPLAPVARLTPPAAVTTPVALPVETVAPAPVATTSKPAPAPRAPLPTTSPAAAGATLSREQVIQGILESMCRRGGFQGAVVADDRGLILAEYNCPMSSEAVAACSSILGEPMKQAGGLLQQAESSHISMDINYVDKIVMRQFQMEGDPYYLIIICPQEVDERSELEVTIDQLISVLTRRN